MLEDVAAVHDEGEPTEIPAEMPAAPVSESAIAHASASDSGTGSNAESQLQADRKPIPSFISGVQNSTASRSQAPAETTASTNGNIRQASSKKRSAKTLNAGTAGQDIRKYFKTADNDLSSREQKAQDLSGRRQDRSGRQQDRAGCRAKAKKDVDKEVPEPLEEGNTAVGLFKHRYRLCRTGADDDLREFQDAPVPMHPNIVPNARLRAPGVS